MLLSSFFLWILLSFCYVFLSFLSHQLTPLQKICRFLSVWGPRCSLFPLLRNIFARFALLHRILWCCELLSKLFVHLFQNLMVLLVNFQFVYKQAITNKLCLFVRVMLCSPTLSLSNLSVLTRTCQLEYLYICNPLPSNHGVFWHMLSCGLV